MAIIGATQESPEAVLRQLDLAGAFLDQVLGIMAAPPTRLSAVTEYGAHIMSLETPQGSLELIMPVGLTVLRIRTFLPGQPDPEFSVAAWTDDRSSNSDLERSSRQGMRNPDTPLPVSPVTLAHIMAHFAGEDGELSDGPMGRWAIGYLRGHGQYPDPDQI